MSENSTHILRIEGMSCAHCEHAVGEALGALPGVTAVSVDAASGQAQVDATGELDLAAAGEAIADAGYTLVA